jgi:hypothetical protein
MLVSDCLLQCSATLAVCAADGAGQDDVLFACTTVEQVSTVGAEDERADSCHFEVLLLVFGV